MQISLQFDDFFLTKKFKILIWRNFEIFTKTCCDILWIKKWKFRSSFLPFLLLFYFFSCFLGRITVQNWASNIGHRIRLRITFIRKLNSVYLVAKQPSSPTIEILYLYALTRHSTNANWNMKQLYQNWYDSLLRDLTVWPGLAAKNAGQTSKNCVIETSSFVDQLGERCSF